MKRALALDRSVARHFYRADTMTLFREAGAADDSPGVMRGHGALFNQEAELWDGFSEMIEPGAFAEAIVGDDVRCLVNHNSDMVLGRNKAGTLRLSEDEIGLYVENPLPNTSFGRDLAVSLDRRDVTQMSFAFGIEEARTEVRGGSLLRIISKVRPLSDVSPVTYPAYEATDAQLYARALGAIGVQGSDVVRAMMKAEYRADLSSSDVAAVKAAIEALEALLPGGEEEEESDEQPAPVAEPAVAPESVSSARSLVNLQRRLRQALIAA